MAEIKLLKQVYELTRNIKDDHISKSSTNPQEYESNIDNVIERITGIHDLLEHPQSIEISIAKGPKKRKYSISLHNKGTHRAKNMIRHIYEKTTNLMNNRNLEGQIEEIQYILEHLLNIRNIINNIDSISDMSGELLYNGYIDINNLYGREGYDKCIRISEKQARNMPYGMMKSLTRCIHKTISSLNIKRAIRDTTYRHLIQTLLYTLEIAEKSWKPILEKLKEKVDGAIEDYRNNGEVLIPLTKKESDILSNVLGHNLGTNKNETVLYFDTYEGKELTRISDGVNREIMDNNQTISTTINNLKYMSDIVGAGNKIGRYRDINTLWDIHENNIREIIDDEEASQPKNRVLVIME